MRAQGTCRSSLDERSGVAIKLERLLYIKYYRERRATENDEIKLNGHMVTEEFLSRSQVAIHLS